jgi:DNA processing protein
VAIVGSRRVVTGAADFTKELAARLVGLGVVVVSGGAVGIDGAAHTGAMQAGGRTWVVAPTGHTDCFPPEHEQLFKAVAKGPGAMLWPFGSVPGGPPNFRSRNGVLVGLADAVVVVQAGFASGALNAATWARKTSKPLWVAPGPPWAQAFVGSRALIQQGATPLYDVNVFIESLGQAATAAARDDTSSLGAEERRVLEAVDAKPRHTDEIALRAQLSAQEVANAILTLTLETVVVEGPPGFFRRSDPTKTTR